MKPLTIDDLEKLKIGCAILGSGGGGDPTYPFLMAKYLMEHYGQTRIISVDELKEDDCVVPLSMMGAPLITTERLISGRELDVLLSTIETKLGRKPTVLMAAEIGGANAFTPFLIAAKWDIPILDADMIGRAFPELQMSTCYLNQLNVGPAIMVDCLGNTIILETSDANKLEKIARAATVAMGSSSAVGFYLMNGKEAKEAVIPGTLSQAIKLGSAALSEEANAQVICKGTLIDIDQTVSDGFLQGSVTILTDDGKVNVFYQNEYLLAKKGEEVMISTPDIIVLLEEESQTPLTSESLRYGAYVTMIAMDAPAIWKTPEGLELVGSKAFGY